MDWVTRYRVPPEGGPALPQTVDEAILHLAEGNARFAVGMVGDTGPVSAAVEPPRQAPYGVVLGCSDARAPLETVFDAGPNQLFVVRVAGNVLGDESLGSIEYALANFRQSLKLLTVLGHTGCGAVAAAVEAYLSPKHAAGVAFSRSLRAVVNHILIAVRSAALSLEQRWGAEVVHDPGYQKALAEATVFVNTAMTAYQLRRELRPEEVGVQVVYGVYDLVDCRVGGAEPHRAGGTILNPAPTKPQELVDLGITLATAERVARHLTNRPGGPGERPA